MNNLLNSKNNYFYQSIKNAYGSKANFEHELIYKAFENGNSGKLYFIMNKYLNFSLSKSPKTIDDYILLTCNLDTCDIYNFVDDIDYIKLENAYLNARTLIESKQIISS